MFVRNLLRCLLVAASALAVGACFDQTSDLFCCTTSEACAAAGETEMFPCPDGAYCDNAGTYGVPRTCIPDPGEACDGPEDCSADLPYCVEGTCAECEDDASCGADAPVCEAATDACGPCSGDGDCSGRTETPRCETTSGACVICVEAADCTAATAPVCDGNECRACQAHSECGSEACDLDTGGCVAESDIIYVAIGGTAGSCTQAAPCATFAQALLEVTGSRRTIRVRAGSYLEQVTVATVTVSIVGEGAILEPTSVNQPVMFATTGADLTIRGLTIQSAGGTGVGLRCDPGAGADPTVHLEGVKLKGNAGGGLSASNCAITVRNSMIVQNGGPSATVGGVNIQTPTALVFEFNTVANNVTVDGFASGVQCTSATARTLANNIIVGVSADQASSTNCSFEHALSNESLTGTGNQTGAASFVDPGNGDFHVQATSLAVDAADPAATLAIDFDGDARPAGTGRDIGADEVSN